MLSRRNIRVKVMQLLFSKSRDKDLDFKTVGDRFLDSIDKSYHLYLLNLYLISRICSKAELDLEKRRKKHLPSEEDKIFSAKIWTNELTQSIANHEELQKKFENLKFDTVLDDDLSLKFYKGFSKTEIYKAYISEEESAASHCNILLELFKYLRASELYNELMEDIFPNWLDDKSLIIGVVKRTIKALPTDKSFAEAYYPDDDTIYNFGETLLNKVYKDDRYLEEVIQPALKNWDMERLALIDMILLKMAICEFLQFSSIPTKVTLNEYVDIAKNYSTAKSKDFVNGILDRILKKLDQEGKIKKEGRGLVS